MSSRRQRCLRRAAADAGDGSSLLDRLVMRFALVCRTEQNTRMHERKHEIIR